MFLQYFNILQELANEAHNMMALNKQHKLEKSKSLQNLYPFRKKQMPVLGEPTTLKIQPLRVPKLQPQPTRFLREPKNRQLKRMKSAEMLKSSGLSSGLQNLAQFYKQQNDNLLKQNKFLQAQIRKRKKNQETLCNYIRTLQEQVTKLEYRCKISPSPPLSLQKKYVNGSAKSISRKNNYESFSTQEVIQQSSSMTTLETQMQELNYQLNNLMQKCSKQTNKKVKNVLRSKIAETAEKMRSFKKEFNDF